MHPVLHPGCKYYSATQTQESEIAMNKKLAQALVFINQLNLRQIQVASLFLMLAVTLIAQCPADGGGGPV